MSRAQTIPWYERGPAPSEVPPGTVPTDAYLIGSADVPLRVFLRRRAWEQMRDLADALPNRLQGGLWTGHVLSDGQPFITVENIIPAHRATTTGAGITFTESAWDEMRAIHERMRPDEIVVGWFRTHQSRGPLLTGYDRFTARRFFRGWWQATYVLDTLHNRQGLYVWDASAEPELRPAAGIWVYETKTPTAPVPPPPTADDTEPTHDAPVILPTPATPPAPEATKATEATETTEVPEATETAETSASAPFSLIALLFLLVAMLAISCLPAGLPGWRAAVTEQETTTDRLSERLQALQGENEALHDALDAAVTEAMHNVDTDEDTAADAPPAEMPDTTSVPPAGSVLVQSDTGQSYVVREGDTLWSISEQLLGDPFAYESLVTENAIDNPHLILPGWELAVPPEAD